MFVIGADGSLYERKWDKVEWVWKGHRHPMQDHGVWTHLHKLLPTRPVFVSESLITAVMVSGQLASLVLRKQTLDWEVRVNTDSVCVCVFTILNNFLWQVYDVPVTGIKPRQSYLSFRPMLSTDVEVDDVIVPIPVAADETDALADYCSNLVGALDHCVFGQHTRRLPV